MKKVLSIKSPVTEVQSNAVAVLETAPVAPVAELEEADDDAAQIALANNKNLETLTITFEKDGKPITKEIVRDNEVLRLQQELDGSSASVQGKWYALIMYGKEAKLPRSVILHTLLSMGKTYSSAQSITSYITKFMRDDMAEALAELGAGTLSVRASRQSGVKRQASPAGQTAEAKMREHLSKSIAYAVGLDWDFEAITSIAETFYNEHFTARSEAKAAKKAQGPVKP
jgi:hypothetical protein